MDAWFFTEMAYTKAWDPRREGLRVDYANANFDPEEGARLLNRHLDEWMLADELGLNIATNEHHSTATCMAVSPSIVLGILARQTKKARLLALGHAIANRPDPVRVAEETAFVDVLSRGRVEVGMVRGSPPEVAATNSNPTRMHDRFWEAHDLILKAWTTRDGPFNWEGTHFSHRQVNIWPRPYQEPHPPVWISGTSLDAAKVIAQRGYVFATFFGGYRARAWLDAYREEYLRVWNRPAADDRLGCMALVAVGDTDEEGFRRGDMLRGYLRTAPQVARQFANPPGFLPPALNARIMRQAAGGGLFSQFQVTLPDGRTVKLADAPVEDLIEAGIMFAGNPDSVARQISKLQDQLGGFGHLVMMGQAGEIDHRNTAASMTLFAREVMPRFRAAAPTANVA